MAWIRDLAPRRPATSAVPSPSEGTQRASRHWRLVDAVACWVLLMVTGFALATWHPWHQVRWPAPWLPYPLFCAGVVALVWVSCMSSFAERIPRWWTGTCAAALLLYYFGYDLRQRAAFGGAADNTEALEIGARALLDGHDPYGFSTHLGTPIGPLLGGLILAIPLYVLMDSLFVQLVLAFGAAAAAAESVVPRTGLAVVVLWVASPWSRATAPYMNDNGLTALGIVAFGAWGYWLARRDPHLWWLRLTWTAGFACALDYRWTMWIVGLPYFALFLREFGWRKTTQWLLPVLLGTLALFVAPLFFPSGGYRDRTLETLMAHSNNPGGTYGSLAVLGATLLTVGVCSAYTRTLAGVWATMSASLAVLLGGMSLLWLPGNSLEYAFYRYHFFWYLGWVLVFGIASLVTPGTRNSSLRRQRRSWFDPSWGRSRPASLDV